MGSQGKPTLICNIAAMSRLVDTDFYISNNSIGISAKTLLDQSTLPSRVSSFCI